MPWRKKSTTISTVRIVMVDGEEIIAEAPMPFWHVTRNCFEPPVVTITNRMDGGKDVCVRTRNIDRVELISSREEE